MNINDYKKVTDRIEPSERCRDEVLNMNRQKKIKHKMNKRAAAAIITVAVAACSGTAVFAAKKTDLFSKLEANKEQTYITDDGREFKLDKTPDLNNYEVLESAVDVLDEPVVAESEDLTVNIETMYCDGRNLVLGLTGSLANGNYAGARAIQFNVKIETEDEVFDNTKSYECKYNWLYGNLMLEEGTENSFTGQITMELPEENMLTKSQSAVITLFNIHGYGVEVRGEKGEIIVFGDDAYEYDDVVIKQRIVVDQSLINGTALRQEEDGFSVKLYDYTPANIRVEWSYPDEFEEGLEWIEGYEGVMPKYSLILLFYDENGNYIPFLNDGIAVAPTYGGSLTTPTDNTVIARIYNKQIQDENGNMMLMKEFTFDISELRTAE